LRIDALAMNPTGRTGRRSSALPVPYRLRERHAKRVRLRAVFHHGTMTSGSVRHSVDILLRNSQRTRAMRP
jgi:hypothetical protein